MPRLLLALLDVGELMLDLLDLIPQFGFVLFPFGDLLRLGFGMQRERGEAGLSVSQLTFQRAGLPVQFPPGRVDYLLFGRDWPTVEVTSAQADGPGIVQPGP